MVAAIVIGIIATIIAIGFSISAINTHCLNKYDYKPFSLGNAALSFLSLIILVIMFMTGGSTIAEFEMNDNTWVILGLYIFIILAMLWNIAKKTSFLISLYTIIILQFFSFLAVVILFAIRALWQDAHTDKKIISNY